VYRAEDQDLLLRRHKHSRFANLPDVLLGYRQERLRASHILYGDGTMRALSSPSRDKPAIRLLR
jgi:hypothetical protein